MRGPDGQDDALGRNRLRAIPGDLDGRTVNRIEHQLSSLAAEHGVAIPWAIESGSRAWGFPSPDSDYDCRFFFVRSLDDYLSPWPAVDVLEVPIEDAMDLNGWDLGKAVRLLVQGNPTVVEWLRSPIVYSGDPEFRSELLELADAVADRSRFGRHYLHVARNHWKRAVRQDGRAKLKTLMYVLRAVLSLRWLRLSPTGPLPPMNLAELMAGTDLPEDVVVELGALVARKAKTREMGTGSVPTALRRLIESELGDPSVPDNAATTEVSASHRQRGTEVFRTAVRRFGPA